MGTEVSVGGQAVVGGVMMRAGKNWCVAVRRPDGTIVQRRGTVTATGTTVPVWRGVVGMWQGLRLGADALVWSGRQQLDETERDRPAGQRLLLASAIVPVLVFGLLFMAVPAAAANALGGAAGWGHLATLACEGALRIALLVAYVAAVGRNRNVAEVFRYHGAEHKVVNAHEQGLPATLEVARGQSVVHRRCGTTFTVLVMVVAVGVFAFLPPSTAAWGVAARFALLPLVAGVSYELLKFLDRHQGRWWSDAAGAPGRWLQSMTTNPPDDPHLEVALAAMAGALDGAGTEAVDPTGTETVAAR